MTRRRIICCVFLVITSTFVPVAAFAQNPVDDEARTVTAGCHQALKRATQLQNFDAGMCLGVLKGLHYLSKDICIPPATSLGEIGSVVAQYLDRHAGNAHDDFQEDALHAMRSAWPCGGRTKI